MGGQRQQGGLIAQGRTRLALWTEAPQRRVWLSGSNIERTVFPSLLISFSVYTAFPSPSSKPCSTRAEMVLPLLIGEPEYCCWGAGDDSLSSQKYCTEVRQQTLYMLWQRVFQLQPRLLPDRFLRSKARWSRKNSSLRDHRRNSI